MFGRELRAMEKAMDGLTARFTAQANNIANINTPHYERQAVQFEDALRSIMQHDDVSASSASEGFSGGPAYTTDDLLEMFSPRTSTVEGKAHRVDGNGSTIESEMADIVKTAQRFNTVSTVVASEYRTLKFITDQR